MNVTFNVKDYIDRRSADLLKRYQRVEARRAAQSRRKIQVEQRMAAMGPHGQGAASTESVSQPRIWPATTDAPFRVVSVRSMLDRR